MRRRPLRRICAGTITKACKKLRKSIRRMASRSCSCRAFHRELIGRLIPTHALIDHASDAMTM